MDQDSSLLREALENANLASSVAADEFWEKRLGKNARTKAVRKRYIRDSLRTPVNKNVIFYETMSGARMGDNPLGIFEYLRSHPEHGEFLHVWSIDARGSIPERYKNAPDVVFARRNTRSYTYFLSTAGYVVCNANLPGFFTRRPGQKYLNTWHGIPYKSLGRNTPSAKFGSAAGNGTFAKASHILSPCEFATEKMISAYSMSGVSTATFAEIGYPRIDRTLEPKPGLPNRLRTALGLKPHDRRPAVLYAPTWRSENAKDVVDADQLLEDLKALEQLDIQLMYRGHHRMDRIIRDASVGDQLGNVIIPPHEISSNDLLTVVDILITDFSSIFFDFLPTGRPIVHYLYDLDGYAGSRGVNLETTELPGSVALDRHELQETVTSIVKDLEQSSETRNLTDEPLQGTRYKTAQTRFCPHEDGFASKRAVEFLLHDQIDGYPTRTTLGNRPTAAFWAGELKAGPRCSDEFLKALLKSAASPLEQTVLIVDRKAPISDDFMKKIKKFGNEISTVSYEAESLALLQKEEEDYKQFASNNYLDFDTVASQVRNNKTLNRIYTREFRRRLDDAQFDRVFLAADLSYDELAIASMARQRSTASANLWVPLSKELSTRQKAVGLVLPKGSARRKFVARKYRELRSKIGR